MISESCRRQAWEGLGNFLRQVDLDRNVKNGEKGKVTSEAGRASDRSRERPKTGDVSLGGKWGWIGNPALSLASCLILARCLISLSLRYRIPAAG